jgi:AraC-like DNA-binding protein
MSGRFRVSRLMLTRLEEQGVPPQQIWREADLPAALLADDRILLTTAELFAFWSAVGRISDDPLIGLRLGSEDRIERYDPMSIAALAAASFRDAIERAGRYKQLTCPEEIDLVDQGDESAVRFRWLLADGGVPQVLHDLCFAWILTLGRRGTGVRLQPRRLELTSPTPDADRYRTFFGCAIEASATENARVCATADLARPFRTRNTEVLAMIEPQLDAELATLRPAGTAAEQVKRTVKRLIAGRRPELRDVARAMGVSTRTLQRRLAADGVTYQQLVEQARRELAHHYLLHSALELSETAYLLGYEDASSFFRAFSQWEGAPPGRWREQQRTLAS